MQHKLWVMAFVCAWIVGGCESDCPGGDPPTTTAGRNTGDDDAMDDEEADEDAEPDEDQEGADGKEMNDMAGADDSDAVEADDDAAKTSDMAATEAPPADAANTATTRAHDERTFNFDADMQAPFAAIEGVDTDRWSGTLDGAGYRIEVPREFNGTLVMYAHGYAGTGEALRVGVPPIRKHLIEQGFAWAASSYRANYYDVRAGVEDTNQLALAVEDIAADNDRTIDIKKYYIIGHSMGGHISGAAVEQETIATAQHPVEYDAALPMCGVMGDTELFNYFKAYEVAAHQLADMPETEEGFEDYEATKMQVQSTLFSEFPLMPTPAGDSLKAVVINLSGGERPVFEQGWANGIHAQVWATFGGDGTINGILAASVLDTRDIVYQFDNDPKLSSEEEDFNDKAFRAVPDAGANGLRDDGLRWIPAVRGEFSIPVITLHTLGDLYVPFSMQQIYRRRAEERGSSDNLVQRAIRGGGHCEFTYAEQVEAFDALVAWEEDGVKPDGDDVLDPELVADPAYGCAYTRPPGDDDSPTTSQARSVVPECPTVDP